MYILAIFPLDNTLSVQVLPMYPTFYYLNYFPFTQPIFFPYLTVSQSSLSLSLLTSSHPLPFTQPLFFDQPIPYLAADLIFLILGLLLLTRFLYLTADWQPFILFLLPNSLPWPYFHSSYQTSNWQPQPSLFDSKSLYWPAFFSFLLTDRLPSPSCYSTSLQQACLMPDLTADRGTVLTIFLSTPFSSVLTDSLSSSSYNSTLSLELTVPTLFILLKISPLTSIPYLTAD